MNITRLHDEAGMSLVELMVASLIILLLLGAVYSVLFQSQATIESQLALMDLRQQARVAANQMTADLRMTGYDLGNLSESLLHADADHVIFVADIDAGSTEVPCGAVSENAAGGGAERIDYHVVAGLLVRTVDCWDGNSWTNEYTDQRLAANLLSLEPVFRYLDGTGVELAVAGGGLTAAQRDQVRSIVVTLVLEHPDIQVLDGQRVRYRLEKQVGMRNSGS